jgi:hypothetical protein
LNLLYWAFIATPNNESKATNNKKLKDCDRVSVVFDWYDGIVSSIDKGMQMIMGILIDINYYQRVKIRLGNYYKLILHS